MRMTVGDVLSHGRDTRCGQLRHGVVDCRVVDCVNRGCRGPDQWCSREHLMAAVCDNVSISWQC